MNKAQKQVAKSQLKKEKDVIDELKQIYEEAIGEIEENIQLLMANSMTQSKIYQIEYQKQLKNQLDAILTKMNAGQYQSVDQYIRECYQDGWIGAFYEIKDQGIPIIAPIDQEAVIKAVSLDSKLSKPLYEQMGINVQELKKSVSVTVSRGLSSGQTYQDISRNLNNQMNIGLNKSIRIARTEGHRVTSEATMDAMKRAKEKGADIVKQWDSTQDRKTRPSHQRVDGEIREMDEAFSNGLMFPGDPSGTAAEVVNCRCVLLQRARWALDEEELKTLKERAEYFGLDKTETFEEFRKKYLNAMEQEKASKNMSYAVDSKIINSREYADKFNEITDDPELKREMLKNAKEMLRHRSGQNGEDLYLYNVSTKKWVKSTTGKEAGTPEYTQEILDAIAKARPEELISFHNHPSSMPPSDSDINSATINKYLKGYSFCHDGKIFEYSGSLETINEAVYNQRVAKFKKDGYNEFDAQLKTIEYLSEMYGFSFREVK